MNVKHRIAPSIATVARRLGLTGVAPHCETKAQTFQDGVEPACELPCDINGDSGTDVADAVYLFLYTLLGGPPPPDPFPHCGVVGDFCDEITAACPVN